MCFGSLHSGLIWASACHRGPCGRLPCVRRATYNQHARSRPTGSAELVEGGVNGCNQEERELKLQKRGSNRGWRTLLAWAVGGAGTQEVVTDLFWSDRFTRRWVARCCAPEPTSISERPRHVAMPIPRRPRCPTQSVAECRTGCMSTRAKANPVPSRPEAPNGLLRLDTAAQRLCFALASSCSPRRDYHPLLYCRYFFGTCTSKSCSRF